MANKIPQEFRPWIEAKEKHRLSQKHIQMARELGMNPKGFYKLDNPKQKQQWKLPLPEFIEKIYYKRFHKEAPDQVYSFEQLTKLKNRKAAEKKERKAKRKAEEAPKPEPSSIPIDNSNTPETSNI